MRKIITDNVVIIFLPNVAVNGLTYFLFILKCNHSHQIKSGEHVECRLDMSIYHIFIKSLIPETF
jgi:hypothetical protein